MYNPWSILSFLAHVDHDLVPYWVDTSSNRLIKELLQHHAFMVQGDIETLLEGGSIDRHIEENVVFPELQRHVAHLWNLLVFSGYLKDKRPGQPAIGESPLPYRLSIPNREVAHVYRTTFQMWMDDTLMGQGGTLCALLEALLSGNAARFEQPL